MFDELIKPLADRMRPVLLDEFFGQKHILKPGKPLYEAVLSGRLHSMIFWGPPGTGKTTVADILSRVYSKIGIFRKVKFNVLKRIDIMDRKWCPLW